MLCYDAMMKLIIKNDSYFLKKADGVAGFVCQRWNWQSEHGSQVLGNWI
jgi:hypothetical protein